MYYAYFGLGSFFILVFFWEMFETKLKKKLEGKKTIFLKQKSQVIIDVCLLKLPHVSSHGFTVKPFIHVMIDPSF